jgi:medium-chain acyl-[acyl-carrier-protein] hydrolase
MDEPPFRRMDPLIDALAEQIKNELHGQFSFYGHSLGALICFELTRELRRRKLPLPFHLFLSGRPAPAAPRVDPPTFNLPAAEFIAEIQKLNGTPEEFFDHPEMRDIFLPLLRADFEIVDTYEYRDEESLQCPITVYGGRDDKTTTVDGLRAWQRETSAGCLLRMVSGDHFFIRTHKMEFMRVFRRDLLASRGNRVPE